MVTQQMKVCNTKIQKEACKWFSTSIVRDLHYVWKLKLLLSEHSYMCIECELDNPRGQLGHLMGQVVLICKLNYLVRFLIDHMVLRIWQHVVVSESWVWWSKSCTESLLVWNHNTTSSCFEAMWCLEVITSITLWQFCQSHVSHIWIALWVSGSTGGVRLTLSFPEQDLLAMIVS